MRASAVVVLLALPLALPACNKKNAEQATKAPPAPPVKVDLVTAVEAPSPELLTLTGILAADQRSEVTADTAGKVLSVMIERGQRVKMGDPVVRLDVRNAALSAREAQANLAAARADLDAARTELGGTRAALAATRGELAATRSDLAAIDAELVRQRATLAEVQARLAYRKTVAGWLCWPLARLKYRLRTVA